MTDNGRGADLGASGDRSTDRLSQGIFGGLTSDLESDDFVDSILNAVDEDVAAQMGAGLLTGETPAVAFEPPVAVKAAPAPIDPIEPSDPIDPFLADPAPVTEQDQIREQNYDEFWDKKSTPNTPSSEEPQWGGAPEQIVAPKRRAPREEPTGSALQLMMSNEPRFVMAAGALIALGLILAIIGAIVLT